MKALAALLLCALALGACQAGGLYQVERCEPACEAPGWAAERCRVHGAGPVPWFGEAPCDPELCDDLGQAGGACEVAGAHFFCCSQ